MTVQGLVLRLSGSTPRMRGIFNIHIGCVILIRFNPAYAGNILSYSFCHTSDKVQPRVCGEYTSGLKFLKSRLGSTPRMRGIFVFFVSSPILRRFNPAYAGNILPYVFACLWVQVQPRVCGEYLTRYPCVSTSLGSTPRMRGISYNTHFEHIHYRFNPAYAGNIG